MYGSPLCCVSQAMGDILSHPWFLASLPSTALHMNDKFIAMNDYTGVQVGSFYGSHWTDPIRPAAHDE